MAMTARATNIGGTMIAEKRAGSRRFHSHDSLGSTIALVSDANKITDTYTYWPYGEIRTSTGSLTATPFKFCGAWGYYDDGNQLYVRARYLRQQLGRWITRDPLWPDESAYAYVGCDPILLTDKSGLSKCKDDCCCCAELVTIRVVKKFRWESWVDPTGKIRTIAGHEIEVSAYTSIHGPLENFGRVSDCKLEWFESTNQPYGWDPNWKGAEREMVLNGVVVSGLARSWESRPKPCPGLP